jgi:hypothetical protein
VLWVVADFSIRVEPVALGRVNASACRVAGSVRPRRGRVVVRVAIREGGEPGGTMHREPDAVQEDGTVGID